MAPSRALILWMLLLPWPVSAAGMQETPAPDEAPEAPKYRVDAYSNLFELRVFHPDGRVRTGLSQADLEIRVGSRRGTILWFEEKPQSPISLAILVDLGSNMDEDAVRAAKQASFELIHLLQPEDEILVGVYHREVEFLVELTTDRLTLVEGLNNITTGARSGFWKRLAQGFGTSAPTGLAVDEALLRLKRARHPLKAVLVFSAAFGNLGRGTADHLALAGARFFGVGWKNRLGDAFGLGGDRLARGHLLKESGGLVFDAQVILERLELLTETMTHFYLVAWTAEGEDGTAQPEFRVRGCPGCRIAAVRRLAARNPFY